MNEIRDILLHAQSDIQRLRQRNEVLEAKNQVIEIFGAAIGQRQGEGHRPMSEDVAWRITRMLAKIDEDEKIAAVKVAAQVAPAPRMERPDDY